MRPPWRAEFLSIWITGGNCAALPQEAFRDTSPVPCQSDGGIPHRRLQALHARPKPPRRRVVGGIALLWTADIVKGSADVIGPEDSGTTALPVHKGCTEFPLGEAASRRTLGRNNYAQIYLFPTEPLP